MSKGKIKQNKVRIYSRTEVGADGKKKVTKYVDMQSKQKDPFYMGYLEHVGFIAKLPRYQLQTLLCVTKVLEYHTGEFQLGEKDMLVLTECSGLKEGSIRSAISHLKRKNIVQSKGRNWYVINPAIMWKGAESERETILEVIFRYQGGIPQSPPESGIKSNEGFLLEQTDIIIEDTKNKE